ncbi:MAG: T9SS type A sorting domain-containing protein [Deferribacteres bacterium]|nr:T9SS type A sorting domain-containing protein [candidate division KSB1 bacterium]MCB9503673.1 T9SS type A sorting domain-containing protein [Deferribacteres bacterium]
MISLRSKKLLSTGAIARMLFAAIFTLASALPLTAADNVPAFTLGNVTDFPASNSHGISTPTSNIIYDATFGWSFTVGAGDVVVSALGIYDSGEDGLFTSHEVGIWTSAGVLVASISIPSGTSATLISGCRYVNITPVTLQAGQTYVIGAYYPPIYATDPHQGDQIIISNTNTNEIFFSTPITWGNARQSSLFDYGVSPLTFPDIVNNGYDGCIGPNFLCHYVELSINDVTLNESNAGTTSFDFTVSLTQSAPASGVTFDIATADGTTNPATAASDYTAKSLTGQTIPSGNSTYTFSVLVNGDTDIEADETFFVNVSNVTGAYVSDGQGIGTITNDDAACVTDPVVTNNADSGPGSLRQAIIDACPGSTITFDMNQVVSPINLTSSLTIDKDLTIQGPGAGLLDIHNTQNTYRVFYVGNVTATLSGLTISGGRLNYISDGGSGTPGAGIYNSGNLTLSNCTVTDNTLIGCWIACDNPVGGQGAGIFNASGAILVVNNCQITNNKLEASGPVGSLGAGFFNAGSATINNSTIANNQTEESGGGIVNQGALAISGSTISSNIAVSGAGIHQLGGSLHIYNSTISGNGGGPSVDYCNGAGIYLFAGTAEINSCTITGNYGYGGGIRNGVYSLNGSVPDGQFTIRNSIVAGNTGPEYFLNPGASTGDYFFSSDASIPPAGYPKLTSLGNNIFGKVDPPYDWTFIGTGDQVGSSSSPIDPLLGPLADNGGATMTCALLPGSPAINAGTSTDAPTTDQRGITRPQLGGIDMGAYESRGFTMAVSGGNNQNTVINTSFSDPLAVTISSSFGEPVDGGKVTFTPPASGASSTIAGNPATITGGVATTGNVTANSTVGGPYMVAAGTNGATGVNFSLTNNAVTAPQLSANLTDALLIDNNNDGIANPGDRIKYTVIINNTGTGDANSVTYSDTLDFNVTPVAGSGTTTQGTINDNYPGPGVYAIIGTIAPGEADTLTFAVDIKSPLTNASATAICNQGAVGGSNVTPFLSDDPDAGGGSDPTCTPLSLCGTPYLVSETPNYDTYQDTIVVNAGDTGGLASLNFSALSNFEVINSNGFTSGNGLDWTAPGSNPQQATFILQRVNNGIAAASYAASINNVCGGSADIDNSFEFAVGCETLASILNLAIGEIETTLQAGSLPYFAQLELNAAIADIQQAQALLNNNQIMNSICALESAWQHAINAVKCGADLTNLLNALIDPIHDLAVCKLDEAQAFAGTYEIDVALAYSQSHLSAGDLDRTNDYLDEAIKQYLISYYASEYAIGLGGGTVADETPKLSLSKTTGATATAQISELQVIPAENGAELSWVTGLEVDVKGFLVFRAQRSFADVFANAKAYPATEEFKIIGDLVPGTGTSQHLNEYSFTDTQLSKNTFYYYMILEVFSDGSTGYPGAYNNGPVSVVMPEASGRLLHMYNMAATSVVAGVELSWQVDNAERTRGYHVYRAEQINGQYVRVNSDLLTDLSFTDATVAVGRTYYYKVADVNEFGLQTWHNAVSVDVSAVTAVAEEIVLPTAFALEQNYPNPFNPTTNITFSLPQARHVSLNIYNAAGQLVRTLTSGQVSAGQHSVVWDARDDKGVQVSSGVYLYTLRAGEFVAQRKLLLMK